MATAGTGQGAGEAAPAASLRGEKILHRMALPFGYAGALVLLFMMLYTTYAVLMRQLFDSPVFGVVDVMELALVACIFIALPGIFLRDENITVDIVDQLVPRRVRIVLRFVGLFLTLLLLSFALFGMYEPALDKYVSGEQTMALGISRFNHWIPIIFGVAFSILGTLAVLFIYLRFGVREATFEDNDPDAVHSTETGA